MPTNEQTDLEHDVSAERARVDATINEIQNRLTPGQLIDEVLRHGRAPGKDFVASLGRTLADNPIPTALVGVGLMWLLLAPKPLTNSEAPAASVPTPTGDAP
jgi:hypothetical protein